MNIKDMRVGWTSLFTVLCVSLATLPAAARDCVTPSSDVVTGTVMRAQPTTSSARIGTLKPGQSLPFLGSHASWYEAQRADGSSAFLSKRWTQIGSCPASTQPPGGTPPAGGTPQPGTARTEPSTSTTQPTAPVGAVVGPAPLVAQGHPVDWWFVFKFNAVKFPGCGNGVAHPMTCPFGGRPQSYADSQQFVFASSEHPRLAQGDSCAGASEQDPIGATYDELYNGRFHYVVWNDQFKGDPSVSGCGPNCDSPWGHSKGMVAWDDSGNATVMQVTTPSWPGAGNQEHPRHSDGNTLGCVVDDNVKYSQHFFALRLTKDDLINLLHALQNASVGTDPTELQVVNNGGPTDVQNVVAQLGKISSSTQATMVTLSSGVKLISKPSALHVPPWQLVSSLLGAVPLRVATWWTSPAIDSTTPASQIDCWSSGLARPGAVQIATSGTWNGGTFGLKGLVADGNHAKIGVTTDGSSGLTIFGDMNQQGSLTGTITPTGTCKSSQNGRGGLFFVVQNSDLSASVAALITGDSGPTQ